MRTQRRRAQEFPLRYFSTRVSRRIVYDTRAHASPDRPCAHARVCTPVFSFFPLLFLRFPRFFNSFCPLFPGSLSRAQGTARETERRIALLPSLPRVCIDARARARARRLDTHPGAGGILRVRCVWWSQWSHQSDARLAADSTLAACECTHATRSRGLIRTRVTHCQAHRHTGRARRVHTTCTASLMHTPARSPMGA